MTTDQTADALLPAKLAELAAATRDWDNVPLHDEAETLWPIKAGELRELLTSYRPLAATNDAQVSYQFATDRHKLCRLIEGHALDRDDHSGLPLGHQVEALADAIHDALLAQIAERDARIAKLTEALERIAGSHWERVGMDQTDTEDVPDLTDYEMLQLARTALGGTP